MYSCDVLEALVAEALEALVAEALEAVSKCQRFIENANNIHNLKIP